MADDAKPKQYTIRVDRDKCIGAASCVGIASGTFKLDDQNKAIVISQTGDTAENVLLAAQSCPTNAITLTDEAGNQVWPK
jgi:ferredoxin